MRTPADPLAVSAVCIATFALSMTILALFPAISQILAQSSGVMTLIAARRLRIFSRLVGAAAVTSNLAAEVALVLFLVENRSYPVAWVGSLGGIVALVLIGLTIPLLVRYSSIDAGDVG